MEKYFLQVNFNTSYVVIKLTVFTLKDVLPCHFNTSYVVIKHKPYSQNTPIWFISIHLMLLLNTGLVVTSIQTCHDFNTSYVVIKLIINFTRFRCRLISIHLMLLLNLMLAWQMLVFKHFNTSYVVIKLYWRRLGISTILHISIHLMLLLNVT